MQGNIGAVVVVLVIAVMVFCVIAAALQNERTRSVFVGMVLASVFLMVVMAALSPLLWPFIFLP